MPLTTGQTLHHNRYRIVKPIGQGGFGAVYRAWDITLKQPIALKENLDTSQEAQRQFEREARLMAGLRHANLPRVLDHFFVPGQGQYLVMDFIEGSSLAELLSARSGNPFSEAEILPWLQQVCAALDYLHNRQPPIIHRDIKPENIIITPEGQAILVDFGISKVYDSRLATTVGARAVTPGYSPPEQYGGGKTDARTDIYALGATLYRLLTGQEPPSSVEIVAGVSSLTPPRDLVQQLDPALERTILQAMSVNVSQRFEHAADFLAALTTPPATQPEPQKALAPVTPVAPPPPPKPRVSLDKSELWTTPGIVTLRQILKGHTSWVNSVAFAPDSTILASGSRDGTVRLWRVSDGHLLQTLEGHANWVNSVAFAPDGAMLVTGSLDNTLRLWEVSSGILLQTLAGHKNAVNSVTFAPHGELLASGSDDRTVKLWNVSNGIFLETLNGHEDWVRCVAFNSDGSILASGSLDNTVQLWGINTGGPQRKLIGHTSTVNAVAFAPDGDVLASGSEDSTARLWKVSDGTLMRTLERHKDGVCSVTFTPDGVVLATGSWDSTVRLWQASDGMLRQTLKGHTAGVNSVDFSPDGMMLASASDDGTVRLWGIR